MDSFELQTKNQIVSHTVIESDTFSNVLVLFKFILCQNGIQNVVNIAKNRVSIYPFFTRSKKFRQKWNYLEEKFSATAWWSFSNKTSLHLINIWMLTSFSRAFQELFKNMKSPYPIWVQTCIIEVLAKTGKFVFDQDLQVLLCKAHLQ